MSSMDQPSASPFSAMLPKSSDTVDRILQYTAVAADALQDVANTAKIPFIDTVCTLVLTIVPIVQAVKSQKDRCLSMMEKIHRLLSALMSLCVHSDEVRSPKVLDQIAECAMTLRNFHSCLRAQQEIGTIKRLFKQNEITAQLDACEAELKAALQVLAIDYGVGMARNLVEFSIDTERRHQELLELISSQSDTAPSIGRSSLNASSGSLSLLPPSPKIFHGRDSELKQLIEVLRCEPARAVILGPGGMGKTTLAMAALHHPTVTEKYGLSHFISCESADTLGDLLTTIGLHLRLEPSAANLKTILRHFAQCGTCLVVLDNLETLWEPLDSRAEVEEFLSLLADIGSLALLLTMRGAERPAKVKWNRPFLPPLQPLSLAASRQIFVEVADEPEDGETLALDNLLDLTGSLPLAISLMANVASFEGYSTTLTRWHTENTALLSDGHDKRSNLEKSIALSMSSPRISSAPYAKNLSSLLSLLPDGIRADDLIAGKVPIPNVRQCQSVLVGTSLGYIDVNGRLKMLSPVREYVRRAYPPSHSLSRPLREYFQDLLELLSSKPQLSYNGLAPELVGNLGNINQLILEGLMTEKEPAWIGIGESIITLDFFSALMLKGGSPLLQRLPQLIEATGDAALRWRYAGRILGNGRYHLIEDPEGLIRDGIQYFNAGTQPVRQVVNFYNAVAAHYCSSRHQNLSMATKFSKQAFQLAQQTGNIYLQIMSLSIEQQIACICENADWILEVARRARDIAGILLLNPRLCPWLQREARAHLYQGNISRVLDLCTEAEVQLMLAGMEDSDRYLATLDLRAEVLYLKSEYSEANELYGQIVKKTSPSCSPRYHAHGLCAVAEMNIRMESDIADIVSSLNAAETVYLSLGSPRILLCSRLTAELKLYCGDTDNARVAFLECLSKSRGIYPDIAGDCLAALADPAHKMSGPADTFRWAMVYFAAMQKAKKPVGKLQAVRRLADAHICVDDDETSLHLFHAALKGGTRMGIHRLRAECMVGIGEIMLRRGNPMQATEMWGAAHPLFVRSSRMKDAAAVKNRLEMLFQKDSPHSVHTVRNRADDSTDSVSFDFKRSESPPNALESSFKILNTLSPPTYPSLQVKIAVEAGTSRNENTKLPVMQ